MGWLGVWWRQADHYEQLSSHLAARGMATLGRAIIAVIAGGLAVVELATIWTPNGPRDAVHLACTLGAFAGAVAAALLWALRSPSRTAAIQFAVMANASVALATLAQPDPLAAMLAGTTFAAIASFIALFLTAPLMAYNFAIAAVVGAVEAVRIAAKYNIIAAVNAYTLLLLLNFAVPFGIQVVVHVLGADAVRSECDQLTGLLTRHAFHRRARARLEECRAQSAHFVVTVIDLDRFKQLNDRYGHSTGDSALIAVAGALHETTDDTAVICRSGGEEFVIADIWQPDQVDLRAQQLCDAIAALPFGITASIGTAGLDPAYRTADSDALLRELIASADGAMYVAKRGGGNQTGHHRWPSPPLDGYAADESDYPSDGLTA